MTVKELVVILKRLDPEKEILVSSDEEWNTLYQKIDVTLDDESDMYVISGLSGSEVDLDY